MEEIVGQIIRNDVITGSGLVLIPSGTEIKAEHLKLLRQHRINVDELRVAAGHSPNSPETMVRQTTKRTKDIFTRIGISKKIPLMEIKHEIIPMVREVSESSDVFRLFEAVRAKDEYIHQHNVGVSILSTLIGRWAGLDDNELSLLSLAATLHDVGKVRIPDEILHKPGKLTAQEFEEMKRHTIYGYELLKEAVGLHPRVAFVALQHHEREDGSGYPLKLKAPQIDPFSKIVAVADVFHAMSSNRPYHKALPFYEILSHMKQGIFGELDPKIVSLFLQNMVGSMIGKQVQLSDGRAGEIVLINPHEDTRPLVKVADAFIDLSKERDVFISNIIP